jgi:succinoglycan biosynthesis protein ExoM
MNPHPPTITVCIATFRRPVLLEELLVALSRQEGATPFDVVVVDNDAAGSAAPAIARARAAIADANRSIELRSSIEPEQNIARARNRALAEARGEWLAFVDDDERPGERWLADLYATVQRCGADGAFGPVVARLPAGAPRWAKSGRFFERPRHQTDSVVPSGELRTGNALIRRSLLAVDGGAGPFDPRFGLSGGEDTVALARLAAAGARFVWADHAVVEERVPPERARLGFLLRRSFSGGCGHALHRLDHEGAAAAPSLLARGAGALGCAAVMSLATLPLGAHRAIAWCCVGASALGKLLGLAGLRSELYRASAHP